MKVIHLFEARDGSRWDSFDDAFERERLIREIRSFLDRHAIQPVGNFSKDFLDGKAYVQQPTGTRRRILEFLKDRGIQREYQGPLGNLLHRLWRIDNKDREWSQVYYAVEADKREN